MDEQRFTPDSPGELVRINTPYGRDWAFVPDPLPPRWELSRDLTDLLGDAREQLGTLNGIGTTLNNPMLLLTPLQHREALRSSSLEGTYATPVELLQYELYPTDPTSEHDRRNVWREVHNHNLALQHGLRRLAALPLSKRLIQEMHEQLLAGVRGREKQPGEFRNRQVHVGSDRRFIPPPPEYLHKCLDDFEQYLNTQDDLTNPLVRAYLAHYQFEAIHPFFDGNGRIGRVLLSLTTFTWHHHERPWLYMSAYFDRYKDEYIDKLFRVSTHGDWEGWIAFCLRGTVEQCRDAIRRCEALHQLRNQLHEEADHLSHRMHLIIDKLFDHPVFKTRQVMEWCDVTRPTAQRDIDQLIDAGIAVHLSGEKPRAFSIPSLLDIAYRESDEER